VAISLDNEISDVADNKVKEKYVNHSGEPYQEHSIGLQDFKVSENVYFVRDYRERERERVTKNIQYCRTSHDKQIISNFVCLWTKLPLLESRL